MKVSIKFKSWKKWRQRCKFPSMKSHTRTNSLSGPDAAEENKKGIRGVSKEDDIGSLPSRINLNSDEVSMMTMSTIGVPSAIKSPRTPLIKVQGNTIYKFPQASPNLLPPISRGDESIISERFQLRSVTSYSLANASTDSAVKMRSSILTRSRAFRRLTKWAFEQVESNQSGTVDKKELYAGLLLIHLKLAIYAGPAACKPVERAIVDDTFDKIDIGTTGYVSEDEFQNMMSILCSQILTRVVLQWVITLMIVPLIAVQVLNSLKNSLSSLLASAGRLSIPLQEFEFLHDNSSHVLFLFMMTFVGYNGISWILLKVDDSMKGKHFKMI